MSLTLILSILAVIVIFIIWLKLSSVESNIPPSIEERLNKINNFSSTQQIIQTFHEHGIAVDEQRKKICLISDAIRVFTYKDILSSELFEDGETITKTVRSSQLGGMLIGGLALGGVGAIIGGLSGKTKSSNKIKRIDLRLIVNDTKNPIHDVNFLDIETKKGGFVYNQAIKKARHWHGLMNVLIKQADQEDEAKAIKTPEVSISIADELKKLAELRNTGVLNNDEFEQQKARLLAN